MIIETGRKNSKHRNLVIRICDDCGQRKELNIEQVRGYRKKRGNDKDYCHKCSYKYRSTPRLMMEESPSWNGGKYLNENGYYRVYTGNLKYEYEHKVLLSKYLGRKLLPEEKVHHIDSNKVNNDISNLFLCKNKTDHWACHQSMEECAFLLFDKKIWFDRKSKLYSFHKTINPTYDIDIKDILSIRTCKTRRREGSKYYLVPSNRKVSTKQIHILVAERMYGRCLMASELIHHINGDTLNNDPNNLCLMTRSEHKLCHYSLQDCVAELFKEGVIFFSNGKYFVRQ